MASGECDVKIENDKFQCLTPVIGVQGLAHLCLIGMNILGRWPTIKEAIRVLINSSQKDKKSITEPNNLTVARINNIRLTKLEKQDCG